jgi:hypothetical protein
MVDFSKTSKTNKVREFKYFNDIEQLFNEEQTKELELLLSNLEKENNLKISVITFSLVKNVSLKNWYFRTNLLDKYFVISLSKTSKNMNIALDENQKKVIKKIKKLVTSNSFLSDLTKENYYEAIKK